MECGVALGEVRGDRVRLRSGFTARPPVTGSCPECGASNEYLKPCGAVELHPDGWYAASTIAEHNAISVGALRKRLDDFRNDYRFGWKENPDRQGREPDHLYQFGAVQHLVAALANKTRRTANLHRDLSATDADARPDTDERGGASSEPPSGRPGSKAGLGCAPTSSRSATMPTIRDAGTPTPLKSLSPARQHLVRTMSEIRFGRIEGLHVRDGEPVLDPPPRTLRDIKLGSAPGDAARPGADDFALKAEVVELFEVLDRERTFKIESIEIIHGLPHRMVIATEGGA